MAAAAAVVFALVASVPVVGAGPLAVAALSVAAAALVLVFFGKVKALPVPLAVPLSVQFDGGA